MKTELIGLRIDVDTFRGTRDGVPALLKLFEEENIKASFFFSVGPDNMGRHLWRLLKPAFLIKMLRTKAASLYGWDIIFKGTFWPGPLIGKHFGDIIKKSDASGHETCLHTWDHHFWQSQLDSLSPKEIYNEIERGFTALEKITGKPPVSSAVPGWKCTEQVLLEKEKFPFRYNSDCRGNMIFTPLVQGKRLAAPQIPVNLPTYDEVLGKNGITNDNYNEYMLTLLKPGVMNVLTIHAEAEGISCLGMFREFVRKAREKNFDFGTLGTLLDATPNPLPSASITLKEIPGREGWVTTV